MTKIHPFYLLSLLLLTVSCVTPYQNPHLTQLIPESEFESRTETYSANRKIYDGFLQTMEISATLLNTPVSKAQLDQKARIYQWTPEKYASEKAEMESSLSKETKVFFGFFVPERKHDDLHKPKTLWKIFLDAGGKRYEGKAERLKTIVAEVKSLYPKHNRFYSPYMVIFPVPISLVEFANSKVTITGPVGSTSMDFASINSSPNP
jgi:hypothetical protein